jgi:hypothetical protein
MKQFIVESPHDIDECRAAIEMVQAAGYLRNFKWGCPDGKHCGWAIIDAESTGEALLSVPSLIRRKARVTPIVNFSSKEVERMFEH